MKVEDSGNNIVNITWWWDDECLHLRDVGSCNEHGPPSPCEVGCTHLNGAGDAMQKVILGRAECVNQTQEYYRLGLPVWLWNGSLLLMADKATTMTTSPTADPETINNWTTVRSTAPFLSTTSKPTSPVSTVLPHPKCHVLSMDKVHKMKALGMRPVECSDEKSRQLTGIDNIP